MGAVSTPLSASTQTAPQMRDPQSSGTGERGNLGGEVYVLEIDAACREGKFRRLVVCNLDGYKAIRLALRDAAVKFDDLFGGAPQFAFMRRLPKGVEHGTEVFGMVLLEAEWMVERCVAVGCKTPLSLSTATAPQIADERRDLGGEKKGA